MKKTRVDEVLNRLERMGLDQIIITDANSIFYLVRYLTLSHAFL